MRHLVQTTCAVIIALGVSSLGCGGSTVEVDSPVDLPASFTVDGSADLPTRWWQLFEDVDLDGLVDRALAQNLTLEIGLNRLEAANATARREGASVYPTLDGSARFDYAFAPEPQGGESFSLSFATSYEIDVWGRLRAGRQAASHDAWARQEDLDAAAISLTADIATTWYQIVEQRGQLALLEEQRLIDESVLELVELRFGLGRVDAQDVIRQRQKIESSRADRLRLQSNIEVQIHRLALLLGESPAEFDLPDTATLIDEPALPVTGIPSELIQQRPDVRAAYRRVLAADRRVAAAIADRFPRLSLSGSLSTSTSLESVFVDWIGNLGANLLGPIFDGGRRSAEVDRTRAVAAEALNNYGQTILTALGEVEDALSRDRYQLELIESLELQFELATESLERARDSYQRGGVQFVTVLDALTSQQAVQRSVLSARRDLLHYRIALCRALAGPWDLAEDMAQDRGGRSETTPDTPVED